MNVHLYLTNGNDVSLSIHRVIDDIRFQSNEDILKYILSTVKTSRIYKISPIMGMETTCLLYTSFFVNI